MSREFNVIDEIIEYNSKQSDIYRPSSFWDNASKDIIAEIRESGIENFRSLTTPLRFFVPNYGIPANSFNNEVKNAIAATITDQGTPKQTLAMDDFLSGQFHASSDYRVFLSSKNKDRDSFLEKFSESSYGNPAEQWNFNGHNYSRSALNYLLGLRFLENLINIEEEIKTVLEIGGGFGTLGEILHFAEDIKYIDVDIPPVSYVAWEYLRSIYTTDNIEPYEIKDNIIDIKELKRCTVLNSSDIEKLDGEIDLFVNFISFQEMEPNIVLNYLTHVKRLNPKWILLRNMKEGKQVRKSTDGPGVETPITYDDYIKMLSDQYTLVDSNIIPFGYKTVDGFNSELLLFKKN